MVGVGGGGSDALWRSGGDRQRTRQKYKRWVKTQRHTRNMASTYHIARKQGINIPENRSPLQKHIIDPRDTKHTPNKPKRTTTAHMFFNSLEEKTNEGRTTQPRPRIRNRPKAITTHSSKIQRSTKHRGRIMQARIASVAYLSGSLSGVTAAPTVSGHDSTTLRTGSNPSPKN